MILAMIRGIFFVTLVISIFSLSSSVSLVDFIKRISRFQEQEKTKRSEFLDDVTDKLKQENEPLSKFGTVYIKHGEAKFVANVLDAENGAAYGFYNDTVTSTGWGILDIKAGFGNNVDDEMLMYAAGFLEGVLTQRRILQFYHNVGEPYSKKVSDFHTTQKQWSKDMVKEHAGRDQFWRHVGYVNAQEDGLFDGYNTAAKDKNEKLRRLYFQTLNAIGDSGLISESLEPMEVIDYSTISKSKFYQAVFYKGHCSVLIKVLPGFENVFISHNSWFTYRATLRIYKHYSFNLKDPATVSKSMSFSSYPGLIHSLDDFYMLDSKLVITETTFFIFNASLSREVKPQSILSWQGVRVANHLANSGLEWSKTFAKYQSGTYGSTYMIVDLKKFQLRKQILDGALYVFEHVPNVVRYADKTDVLRAGYWASYDAPFFEEIYNRTEYPKAVKVFGTVASFQLGVRGIIFRRDQGNVKDMSSMKKLMESNDYKNEPYANNNPLNTICGRGDLEPFNMAFGCYDVKVTDYHMALQRMSEAKSGPSYANNITPFSWNNPKFSGKRHEGMPETYNFDYVHMKPVL